MAKQSSPLTELRFPVGGLNRQAGFDQQPPYTTPYCFNVRPFDVVDLAAAEVHGGRQRGGARPGLVKSYAQRCGTGPFQLLESVSVQNADGTVSNILVAIVGGTLYQNSSGSMVAVSGSFNPDVSRLCGAKVGTKFYIADYRSVNLYGTDGTIASGDRLSATSVVDWTLQNIDTAKDVVWISGTVPDETNVFRINTVAAGYLTLNGSMTNQTGGATWQVGRMPKVWDPANPTAAVADLAPTLPIPPSYYRTGTVSVASGVATLAGGTWAGVPAVTPENSLTLEIPNESGIGTRQYLVASLDGNTQLTLLDQTSDADCSGVTYKLFWTADFYGVPPLGCRLCCEYRNRLILAGWPSTVWYGSRMVGTGRGSGDGPADWDYGYDPGDPSRAVGGRDSPEGNLLDPVLALMPHSDQYLIFGGERSLSVMTSDIAFGGSISLLSRVIGVMGDRAWCNLPDGSLIFLSRDGVYQLAAGASNYPQPVSRGLLPAELLDVDYTTNTVSLCYDVWARGSLVDYTEHVRVKDVDLRAANAAGERYEF